MLFIAKSIFTTSSQFTNRVILITLFSIGIAIGSVIAASSVIRGFQHESIVRALKLVGDITTSNPISMPWVQKCCATKNQFGIFATANGVKKISICTFDTIDTEHILCDILINNSNDIKITNSPLQKIFVGKIFAKNNTLQIGNTLLIFTPHYHNGRIEFRTTPYMITGIVEYGFFEFDASSLITFKNNLQTDTYISYTQDFNQVTKYQNELTQNGIKSTSWKEKCPALHEAFDSYMIGFCLLMSIFLISNAIFTSTSILYLIRDQIKTISVLRILGMTNLQLYSTFLYVAIGITISSVLVGVLFGGILTFLLPYFQIILERILQKSIMGNELFWVSKFKPLIRLEDVFWISIVSAGILFVILAITCIRATFIKIEEGIKKC